MKISVVVPVHNGARDLRVCLQALQSSSRQADEIIVVNDASSDDSVQAAREFDVRVLDLRGAPRGPAFARNRGVETSSGDIIVFLDADVFVHQNTLQKIENYFVQNANVSALFGSYDDAPTSRTLVSRYKNLLHHFVHQGSRRDAATFWTGCGAIRRAVFLQMGGFDESFARPSIEDIELGRRLKRAGHTTHLCAEIQAKHGKQWTFSSLLKTDIFARAVPWTQLLAREGGALPNDLNLSWKSRVGALCAWTTVFCALLLILLRSNRVLESVGFSSLGLMVFCNFDLLQFFWRRGGIGFALGASALHFCYYLYSSATWALVALPPKLRRHSLRLLLLATLFKGVLWSVVFPAWMASDEPQQFLYGQKMAQQRRAFITPQNVAPREIWLLADAVQLDRMRFFPENHLELNDRAAVARLLQRVDDAKNGQIPVPDNAHRIITVLSFMRYHPPLYAALLATVQMPLSQVSIRWRLLACRWISVVLAMLTVACAFGAGRELWPNKSSRALVLATLVSFQPIFTFSGATVSNGTLEIALGSALLWMGLRVWRSGLGLRRALFLGTVTGLGMLTKISFVAALPILVLLFVALWIRAQKQSSTRSSSTRLRFALCALVFAVAISLSGWWYLHTFGGGNDLLTESFHQVGKKRTIAFEGWRSYLDGRTANMFGRTLVSYWGNFGWPDTRVATWVWLPLSLLTFGAIAHVSTQLFRARKQSSTRIDDNENDALFSPIFWLGCASLSLILFYVVVDIRTRMQLGGAFGQRGQYYLPAVIGQMAWLMLWAQNVAPRMLARLNESWRLWILAFGMMALNWGCLQTLIAPRYYGSRNLLVWMERATVLQPVSFWFLLSVLLGAMTCSALLALALLPSSSPENSP